MLELLGHGSLLARGAQSPLEKSPSATLITLRTRDLAHAKFDFNFVLGLIQEIFTTLLKAASFSTHVEVERHLGEESSLRV